MARDLFFGKSMYCRIRNLFLNKSASEEHYPVGSLFGLPVQGSSEHRSEFRVQGQGFGCMGLTNHGSGALDRKGFL